MTKTEKKMYEALLLARDALIKAKNPIALAAVEAAIAEYEEQFYTLIFRDPLEDPLTLPGVF